MLKKYMQQLRNLYRGNYGFMIDIALFAAITYFFHLMWWEMAPVVKSFIWVNNLADFLANNVFKVSLWINRNIIGLHVTTENPNTMWFSNGGYVAVEESCSGLKQFYQILVLFMLFPGPWRHKLWFIPTGIAIMHIVNIMRINILSIIVLWMPHYWDFVHTWILRPGFYVVIFLLWVWWVEKIRKK